MIRFVRGKARLIFCGKTLASKEKLVQAKNDEPAVQRHVSRIITLEGEKAG